MIFFNAKHDKHYTNANQSMYIFFF